MIDLHCHSIFSDGLLTPTELVLRAHGLGVTVLALTDHDTLAGLPELQLAAQQVSNFTVLNGIEFSVKWKKYDLHILGLDLNLNSLLLHAAVSAQNALRIERAMAIGQVLEGFGLKDAYHQACEIAGHTRVGRLHFAKLLVMQGMVKDLKSAFKQYLGVRCSAYVATSWLSLEQIINAILHAHGHAVIAHPLKYDFTRTKLRELLKDFKALGGAGIEVVSGDTNAAQILEMAALAKRFDLLASSGSDFHGPQVSRVDLGQQLPLLNMEILGKYK